jgi:hypothetical protein
MALTRPVVPPDGSLFYPNSLFLLAATFGCVKKFVGQPRIACVGRPPRLRDPGSGREHLQSQCNDKVLRAAGSATIDIRDNTGGSLGEAIVIQFALIKRVIA